MRKLIVILFLTTSCSDFELFPKSNIPDELMPMVDEFINQANIHGREKDVKRLKQRLDIRYLSGMKEARKQLGYCDHNGRQVLITLDQEYCEFTLKYHPDRMYPLLFHELGHGYLHRRDVDTKSIMNHWYVQTDDWRSLVDELFE